MIAIPRSVFCVDPLTSWTSNGCGPNSSASVSNANAVSVVVSATLIDVHDAMVADVDNSTASVTRCRIVNVAV